MAILVNYEGLENASSEVSSVKTQFNEEMKALRDIVNATTQNDWKGPDADLFVSNTTTKLDKLDEEYSEFFEQLTNVINENHDVFKETQQKNISMQD